MTDRGDGLNAGENLVAAVLRVTAQLIWVVDPDGLIRFANPAAVAALGYDSADELLGRHSNDTIQYQHPDGTPYPASECPMLLPRATGETVTSELNWFFRRDESMFPVSYVSVPIEMPEGRGAVVAFTDIEELRDLAHGIHPALLTSRGLAAAVEALADRAPVPVHVDIPDRRYPPAVESAAYFVAAEALTNVAKYATASTARVTATHSADSVVLVVEDDGVGGASPSKGFPLTPTPRREAFSGVRD